VLEEVTVSDHCDIWPNSADWLDTYAKPQVMVRHTQLWHMYRPESDQLPGQKYRAECVVIV